ncbi:hypothetical protein N7508_007273 [Penicillium antarcticum]|uniref:uncharacterized protein n=1 Tax=Penicillium antarcticum TaxID=416450 RepID=UPI0023965B41|nr:uncharacterized protein N7508_007273 [Penicillium antarcticum]KAJ5302410.1 hypothetical protein N7508_007273 [Penicillium antarcticum]
MSTKAALHAPRTPLDSILIGAFMTKMLPNVLGTDGTVNQTGTRFNASFTEESFYRLRLVNVPVIRTSNSL